MYEITIKSCTNNSRKVVIINTGFNYTIKVVDTKTNRALSLSYYWSLESALNAYENALES